MTEAERKLWPNSEVVHHCKIDCQCWYAKVLADVILAREFDWFHNGETEGNPGDERR